MLETHPTKQAAEYQPGAREPEDRPTNPKPQSPLLQSICSLLTFPLYLVRLIFFQDMWRNSVGKAVRSLWLHKMRSFLSVLGIIIGTAAMIALMSFGEGSMQDALNDIARQGATNIIVRSVKPPDNASDQRAQFFIDYGIKNDDYKRFKENIPTLINHVPMRIFKQKIWRLDGMVLGQVVGTTKEYQIIHRFEMAAGRFLNANDNKKSRNVAVLGAEVAAELFPFENPLGKTVYIDDWDYIVVGVIANRMPLGTSGGGTKVEEFNKDVYIPYNTCMVRFGKRIYLRTSGSRSGEIVEYHQITLTVARMEDVKPTGKVVENMLKKHHEKDDWMVVIPLDRLEEAERAKFRYTMLLALIASISLLVGGIGIMNIMLATVTERTREIGIRRALGAKRRDITFQFVIEAVVQTGVGGLAGVLLGLSIVFGLPLILLLFEIPLPAVLHVPSIFISVAVSIIVGVIFGLYPAIRASRLDPIEALRHV